MGPMIPIRTGGRTTSSMLSLTPSSPHSIAGMREQKESEERRQRNFGAFALRLMLRWARLMRPPYPAHDDAAVRELLHEANRTEVALYHFLAAQSGPCTRQGPRDAGRHRVRTRAVVAGDPAGSRGLEALSPGLHEPTAATVDQPNPPARHPLGRAEGVTAFLTTAPAS
mmetsp:Transcript_85135/g.214672  ORF Transcript_85135/g.214672 Transcript_85135/m.214672 type:complete len:169 (+) Transcript_85135:1065-1571(+)